MKKVELWETEDGELFRTEEEARDHNDELDLDRLFYESFSSMITKCIEDLEDLMDWAKANPHLFCRVAMFVDRRCTGGTLRNMYRKMQVDETLEKLSEKEDN